MILSFKNSGTEDIFRNNSLSQRVVKNDQNTYTQRTTHPGEILLEEFLKPMGITQKELSEAITVPYQRINEIINGKRGITPSTALRWQSFLGTSEDFWLNLQLR